MRNQVLRFLSASLMAAHSGCVAIDSYDLSRPVSPSDRAQIRKHALFLEIPEARLEIEALNSGLYRETVWIAIYPEWHNVKTSHPGDLTLFVRIEPRTAGLTLDPAKIKYRASGGSEVIPRSVWAPDFRTQPGEERLMWSVPGGCQGSGPQRKPPRPLKLDEPMTLHVLFPVSEDPRIDFELVIDGLMKSGTRVEIPRIQFERKTFRKYSLTTVNE